MTANHVVVGRDGAVLTITMNRPQKKNALTHAMYAAITDALGMAAADPAIRVVLITGTADVFTAGNDLGDFVNAPPGSADSSVLRFLAALSTADKPVVAAVNGLAVGVGTTMLLHCDLVYAARSATFSVPFVNLALVPEAASSLLLPRRIGHAKAAELFLLGGRLDAAEAEDRTSDQPKSLAAGRATMSPRMLGAIQFDRRGMTRVVGAGHAGRAIGSGANDSSSVIWPAWREH